MNSTELLVMEYAHREGKQTVACRKCGTLVVQQLPSQLHCIWCGPAGVNLHRNLRPEAKVKTCQDCGEPIKTVDKGRHRKYCPECVTVRHRQQVAAYQKSLKARKVAQ